MYNIMNVFNILNYKLKMAKTVHFMLCVFYHDNKIWGKKTKRIAIFIINL